MLRSNRRTESVTRHFPAASASPAAAGSSDVEAALAHPPPPSHPSRACGNARRDDKPPICARPTTRRGQRGGGRVRAAYLGRRVTTWAMGMARSPPRVGGWSAPGARAPRPASTDSGACAASTPIGSHRPHVGAVRPALAAHFKQLRMATATSHDGRHCNASPSSAAPVPGRGASALRAPGIGGWMRPLFCPLLAAPPSTTLRRGGPPARRGALATHGCPTLRRSAPSILRRGHTARGWRGVGVTRLRPPAAERQPVLRSAALLWSGGAPERAACSRAPVLRSARAPERPCSRAPVLQSARAPGFKGESVS